MNSFREELKKTLTNLGWFPYKNSEDCMDAIITLIEERIIGQTVPVPNSKSEVSGEDSRLYFVAQNNLRQTQREELRK